jgi:hypothetical protein
MAMRKKTGIGVPKGGGDVMAVNNRGKNSATAAGRGTHAGVPQAASTEFAEQGDKP